jgi:hypothetical protein
MNGLICNNLQVHLKTDFHVAIDNGGGSQELGNKEMENPFFQKIYSVVGWKMNLSVLGVISRRVRRFENDVRNIGEIRCMGLACLPSSCLARWTRDMGNER